jgi:hypothetical protein
MSPPQPLSPNPHSQLCSVPIVASSTVHPRGTVINTPPPSLPDPHTPPVTTSPTLICTSEAHYRSPASSPSPKKPSRSSSRSAARWSQGHRTPPPFSYATLCSVQEVMQLPFLATSRGARRRQSRLCCRMGAIRAILAELLCCLKLYVIPSASQPSLGEFPPFPRRSPSVTVEYD